MAYGKGIEEVFSMQESIEDINTKDPRTGNYSIPTEVIVQKYLKERINPKLPTTSILAALDQRKWEEKQVAEQRGPQQSVLEETISETETVMPTINPMMAQGIAQGQPRPMPGQMPRQMAGLQRPPMPGRVPPQQRMRTGIPMMAAAGGYVPNFADGGIIGYKDRGFVNRYDPNARPFTSPYNRKNSYGNPMGINEVYFDAMKESGDFSSVDRTKYEILKTQLAELNMQPDSLEKINNVEMLERELSIMENTPRTGGGYEKGDELLYTPPEEEINTFEKKEKKEIIDAPGQGVIEEVIEEKTEVSDRVDPAFSGAVGEAEDAAAFLNEYAANQGKDDLFKLEDAVLTGDDAVKAYEKRIGVSPFVALAGKYEQEIGENIAEAKKQSIGKMLFNFGSELTRSGQLGEAAVAAGRDIDKDMNRLIELKREERKVGFDIAKIAEAERQTKGKIGLTAEQQARKDNLTKSLKKREFEILEEKNKIDSIYKDRTGRAALIRAGTERDYYKGQDSLGKQEDRIRAAVIQATFGGPGTADRIRHSKAEALFNATAIANPNKSYDEIIDIAFVNDPSGGKLFRDTELLKQKNERIIRQQYQTSSSTKKPLFKGLKYNKKDGLTGTE